jgi:hypothetical protein
MVGKKLTMGQKIRENFPVGSGVGGVACVE